MGVEIERARFLEDGIIRTEQYYLNAVLEVRRLARLYPKFKIQVGPDIAEFIVEEKEKVKEIDDFVSQDTIDRFEIMRPGFKVTCYDGEVTEAFEKAEKTGGYPKFSYEAKNYLIQRTAKKRREQGLPERLSLEEFKQMFSGKFSLKEIPEEVQ